jgi:hypothetical protein
MRHSAGPHKFINISANPQRNSKIFYAWIRILDGIVWWKKNQRKLKIIDHDPAFCILALNHGPANMYYSNWKVSKTHKYHTVTYTVLFFKFVLLPEIFLSVFPSIQCPLFPCLLQNILNTNPIHFKLVTPLCKNYAKCCCTNCKNQQACKMSLSFHMFSVVWSRHHCIQKTVSKDTAQLAILSQITILLKLFTS